MADVDGNRVVGHRAAQFHRKYGKRFAQTERSPQVLAEFEQRLRFLPRRRDRTEKAALLRLPPSLRLETGVGLNGRFPIPVRSLGLDFRGQPLFPQAVGALVNQLFELFVFPFQHPYHVRIERLPRFFHQPRHRFGHRESPPVLPVRSHRVQEVDRRQNAGANRNLGPLQAHGIAGSVEFFVMGSDDGHNRVRELHPFQNFRAHGRVDLHLLELFGRQAAWFRNNLLGNRQLANVMQQGCGLQSIHLAGLDLELLAHFDGVDADSLQMIVRGLILGLDGQRQRLNGSHVQVGHLFHVPFFVRQFAQVEAVGTVDEVHHRKRQQRRLPVGEAVQPAHHSHQARAHQVIGEAPEIALRPYLAQRPALGQRDHRRHRKCIGDKVNARRQKQR